MHVAIVELAARRIDALSAEKERYAVYSRAVRDSYPTDEMELRR